MMAGLAKTALLLAAGGFGQRPAPSDLLIRSNTNLVEIRVMATDSKRNPVTDLRREDFQVFDNSKPQTIRLFSPYQTAGKRPPAGLSLVGVQEPTAPGYAMILVDWLNTSPGARPYVQDAVIRLLKNYEPRQKLAIYVLSRRPHLLHDFTDDRDILTALMERVDLDTLPDNTLITMPWDNPKSTLRTVAMIGEHLMKFPGRKSLLWVSNDFPLMVGQASAHSRFPPVLFFQDMEKALARLNASDVAVYTINAAGVGSREWDTMQSFADRTGGTYFKNSNDIEKGLRLALEDAASCYTLGFYAPDTARHGLHAIDVKVDRPGVKLRYRESYDPSAAIVKR
jgi:VWFA-related protein